jgi:hypothetical protein
LFSFPSTEFEDRPRNLLFFVNPYGGKRRAVKIFEEHVKPILELCKVKHTVIYTKRRNHATDELRAMTDEQLQYFDGVIAVGGDGTLCEVVSFNVAVGCYEVPMKSDCLMACMNNLGNRTAYPNFSRNRINDRV